MKLHLPKALRKSLLHCVATAAVAAISYGPAAYGYRVEDVPYGGNCWAGEHEFAFYIGEDLTINNDNTNQILTYYSGGGTSSHTYCRYVLNQDADGVITLSLIRTGSDGAKNDGYTFVFNDGYTTLSKGELYSVTHDGKGNNWNGNGTGASATLYNSAGEAVGTLTNKNCNMNNDSSGVMNETFVQTYAPGVFHWNGSAGNATLDYTSNNWQHRDSTASIALHKGADIEFGEHNNDTAVELTIAESLYVDTVTVKDNYTIIGSADSVLLDAGSVTIANGKTLKLSGKAALRTNISGYQDLTNISGDGRLECSFNNNSNDHNNGVTLGEAFTGTLAIIGGKLQIKEVHIGTNATLELVSGQSWNEASVDYNIKLNASDLNSSFDFGYSSVTLNGEVKGNYLQVTNAENKNSGYLTLTNAANDIEEIKITGRILNIEAGSVGTISAAGGTTNIKGGNVENIRISGGTTNITGGVSAETGIIFSTGNASSLNFKLADEAQSATYTIKEIGSIGNQNVYSANITVDSGVELNAAKINNPWGLGTITINGVLNVSETISFATGSNNNTTCNIINGSGVINTQKLELGNVGTYNFTDVTMNIGAGGITQNPKNGGNTWYLNLGDMTFGATADWVFTKPTNADTRVNLVGSGSGTVFDTSDQTDETGKTGYTVTVNANLGGTGSLVKQGAGVLELTGANTYSGGTSIQGGTLKVSGSGTLGSGENEVQKNGTLYIAGTNAATNTALLTSTTGEGNITLGVNASLTGTDGTGQKTQVKGTLTITGDATLTIGSGDNQVNDVSSFSAVKLDNGHIYYKNKGGIINGLTVTANGGSIEVYDLDNADDAILLFDGTTTLTGNLTMTNTYGHKITMNTLKGAGNLVLDDNARTDNVTLTINAVEDFTGKVQIAQSATNMKLNVAEDLGLGIEYGFMDGTTKRTASGHADLSAIKAGNTVSFNSFSGYVTGGDDGVVAADIVLTENEDVAAIDWTDGSKSANLVFDGKVSGSGNIAFGQGKGHNVEFTGDISDYEGTIWGSVTGDNGNSGTSITYSGDATEINHKVASGAVNNTPGVTDVTYKYCKNVVVNGAINKDAGWAGTVNIKVENDSAAENSKVTFNGDVSGKNTVNIGVNAVAEFTSSNVAVSDILVQAAAQLSFTAKESLSVSKLEMQAGAGVSVSKGETVGTLTVTQSATFNGGNVQANLTLANNATVTINSKVALGSASTVAPVSTIETGYKLSLGSQLTLQGSVVEDLGKLAPGSGEVVLFSGVDTLVMGGQTYSVGSHVLTATSGVKLSEVFRSDSVDLEDYYIGLNAHGDVYAGLIVPEPTTATLSLLALAGLCARRRRASR